MEHRREKRLFDERGLDLSPLMVVLARDSAVATPILNESFRKTLHQEAENYPYRIARAEVGEGKNLVRQRMGVFSKLPSDSAFLELVEGFQRLWDRAVAELTSSPFAGPVTFNDVMLQKYEVGEEGITPHRDRTAYRNIICLFVIAGTGRFGVCTDRSGANALEIPHSPGDLILTRAPGFMGSDQRPFHFAEHIVETRYVFGLRQDVSKLDKSARQR